MRNVSSIYEGGALLSTQTDCFMQISLQNLTLRNVTSNFIDSNDGGSALKILANSIKFSIANSSVRFVRSY